MTSAVRRCLPFVLVVAASLWLASTTSTTGDWSVDSWPAVGALAHGHLSDYLSAKAMMGPFSTLLEAPFAALSGGSGLHAYRWAAFPCLLAVGFLGLYLARVAGRRGASSLTRFLIAALCLVNPLTLEALQYGHPEELLTAALAVAAIACASEGHGRRTAVLLGLALASKQWAVVAILPALMALPGRRVRTGLAAGALAALLMLPGVIAAPGSFTEVSGNVASAGRVAAPLSVWYPLVGVTAETQRSVVAGEDGSTHREAMVSDVHRTPHAIGALSHPLIVLLALLLPLLLALRRGRFGLSGGDAMALLALLLLLRCALDPLDNVYYHAPLLLALLGWDALDPGRLPLRGLAGAALALFFRQWSLHLADVAAYNAVYLMATLAAGLAIGLVLFRWPVAVLTITSRPGRIHPRTQVFPARNPNFEDQGFIGTAD